jgi:uncharacterized lipoprotein NlpE involved in copper resistance
MKKIVFMLGVILLMIGVNACKSKGNTEPTMDWPGTYTGVLPCADCEGIQTRITLYSDYTYKMWYQYMGKGDETFNESGTFHREGDSDVITLEGKDSFQYKVGENTLTHLDADGRVITGELAEYYVLVKSN